MDYVHPVDSLEAINIINEWDYPTELGEYELEKADFFEMGNGDGFVWFEEMPSSDGKALAFHVIGSPEKRGNFCTRRAWVQILAWCMQSGAKKLWVLGVKGILQDYALRLGFEQDDTVMDWYSIDLQSEG